MLKKNKNKYLIDSIYVIIFIIFLVLVYSLTSRYCLSPSVDDENIIKINRENKEDIISPAKDSTNRNNNFRIPLAATPNETQSVTQPATQSETGLFTFSSFFDSFASDYLIDLNQTSLYRDNFSAAIMFPPDYTWEKTNEAVVLNPLFPEKRCLGNKCLEQREGKLIYQGKEIAIPKELATREISAITLGALDKRWLVGFTFKNGEKYQGAVYYFNGKKLTLLLSGDKLASPYLGYFGFGGKEDDFLIIYGAYRGIAYRVQAEKIIDVSKFFDYRIMAEGFRPEVIRVETGSRINWYVYSLTPNKPRLIKLWQDTNNEISGEAVYQDLFFGGEEEAIFSFLRADINEISLVARIKKPGELGEEYWQIFRDRGFKNQALGQLVFNPMLIGSSESKIIIKKLANSSLGSQDTPCPEATLLFSVDNKNWQVIPQGYYLNKDFGALQLDKYFLKVNLPAQKDKFYSPFLNEVLFDFYYQK